MVLRVNQKLAHKYYGPYKVFDKCKKVAYKLELPASSKIYHVFYLSQLKLRIDDAMIRTQFFSII